MKVLMIEDDPGIVEVVSQTMTIKWPEVNFISIHLGREGIEMVKKELPDIVLLDLGLPDIDGFQVLRQIRTFSDVLVVIVTVRGEDEDKIRGLEEGADEYMTKPFSPNVLVAQLQALLRRSQVPETTTTNTDNMPSMGKLVIDTTNQTVSLDGQFLTLSPREYNLLNHLFTNKGKMVPTQELMENIFPEQSGDNRFLLVYMNKLLEKLRNNPDNPTIILNEDGKGYKFLDR